MMPAATRTETQTPDRSLLERALSLFTDIRAGEGTTAVLMLVNIFVLLVCYSVIKTVREPLILLGGGAEVRSYAAAGQALLLMGFVPLYGWFARHADRGRLLAGVSLFFVACLELFAAAVAVGVPYVGVAFFVWVGIFNVSLVAQFWSFANDIYTKEAGDRLFPVIVIGMTAGAPFGSFIAGHLFRSGVTPQVILQTSAALLAVSVLLYRRINAREQGRTAVPEPALSAAGGFALVLGNRYLRLVAMLVVLLNVVNTTGEYLIARLLTNHVTELAMSDPAFNKQAFIGAFSGDYQFWVNVIAFFLQAFAASRLVKYRGLAGALLALPLIALGGYAIVAAGAGFTVVRWIKTAENATDYSIMNTARQLLWLPTSRDEKYKAKQAIDAFFVRGGDVLSAAAVYVGAKVLHLSVQQFAAGNIVLTLAWIGLALLILKPRRTASRVPVLRVATVAAALAMLAVAAPARAQESREEELAARQAEKAARLRPYEPDTLERRLEMVDSMLFSTRAIYPFMGSVFDGGGFAAGPAYRSRFGDSGALDAHAAWSVKNYKSADMSIRFPTIGHGRTSIETHANWIDAPEVAFYGTGNDTRSELHTHYAYGATTIGASARVRAARFFDVGAGLDGIWTSTTLDLPGSTINADPTYMRTRVFAELDRRDSPGYTRNGGFYRLQWTGYRQANDGGYSFRRVDAEAQHFVPILRENWVLALRAAVAATDAAEGNTVPYFLLPDLGGSHTLRGYPAWRFRGNNSMILTGEYRWTAGPLLDMALFLDAGKVEDRFRDLGLHGLKATYGIGMSFHTPSSTITRIELARTSEGPSLVFSFSPSF
jgi:ATP:ADP antiporter, AAA family